MVYFINNPLMQIAEFLIGGLILLLVFRILNKFVASLVAEKKRIVRLQWTRIQIVFWMIYALILYSLLFRYNMPVTATATVVVFGLGWNYLRDVFAGILIKLENRFTEGDFVSADFAKGVLQRIYISQSALVNDVGELVIIPNHRLRNAVLTHYQNVSDASIYSVEVRSAHGQTINDIYDFAYNCPYISANKEITIEKQKDNVFNLRASIIDFSFADQADVYFEGLADAGSELEQ